MFRILRVSAPAILLIGAACDLETSGVGSQPPRIRAVNAASATTGVTVHIDDAQQPMNTDPLEFKTGTACVMVLDATHKFAFVQNGQTLASVTGTTEAGKSYTVILVSAGAAYRALLLSDNETAASGTNGLRFINSTSAAGDVHVLPPTGSPAQATLAAGNLGQLALSNATPPFVFRSENDTRVRLYDVGTTSTARSDLGLALLPPSRLANIVFVDKAVDVEPGALQFNACN